jgi:BirA family biotin operon repressor/biotin-[acetyl-CoA-carboxylase] ligase
MTTRQVVLDGAPYQPAAAGITVWHHHPEVESTMDVSHQCARTGAPSGTLVLADVQTAGRGRAGKAWLSRAQHGVWCTLVERDVTPEALQVLSLRIGLCLAEALAPLVDDRLWLKWPNDVLLGPVEQARPAWSALGKLAGILVEARWREQVVEWVAIGVGVNLHLPSALPAGVRAASLRAGVRRAEVLDALVPRLRAAARVDGVLSEAELQAWHGRDVARGRRCTAPAIGAVHGVSSAGALLIHDGSMVHAHRSGSLEVEEGT